MPLGRGHFAEKSMMRYKEMLTDSVTKAVYPSVGLKMAEQRGARQGQSLRKTMTLSGIHLA
jgi:hypothetical protein